MMTYHVMRDSVKTLCGRRIGVPGGVIYPGVDAYPRAWFEGHRYPDAIEPVTCRACARIAKLPQRLAAPLDTNPTSG